MAVLDGVRIGPLDPDRAENFGQVGGQSTARQLIRHHVASHPPALVGALSRVPNEERSRAIDKDEAEELVRSAYEDRGEPLPEESTLKGFAIRGDDDAPELQVLTFVFETKNGRTGKGFVPLNEEARSALTNTFEAGDEAVRIKKLKDAGLPWEAKATAQNEARADRRKLAAADDLRSEVEELRERLARIESQAETVAQASAGGGSGVASSPQTPEGGSASVPGTRGPEQDAGGDPDGGPDGGEGEGDGGGNAGPEDPQQLASDIGLTGSYDDAKAQDIRAKLRDQRDPETARRVLAYETRSDGGQNRSTVVAAANEVLDRPPAAE